MVEAGKTYRIFYNHGNVNNQLIHVRAIVDINWVVYRTWSRRKMTWRYRVEHTGWFRSLEQFGILMEAKR